MRILNNKNLIEENLIEEIVLVKLFLFLILFIIIYKKYQFIKKPNNLFLFEKNFEVEIDIEKHQQQQCYKRTWSEGSRLSKKYCYDI